jgi:hypothetical protein
MQFRPNKAPEPSNQLIQFLRKPKMKPVHPIIVALALVVSGCTTSSGAWLWTVTRFHTVDLVQGKTYVIVPLRKEYADSLEFQAYAAHVAHKMSAYGLARRSKDEIGKTDFLIALDYGIGEPYQLTYSYPMFGQVAGGTTLYRGTAYSAGKVSTYSGTATTVPQFGVVGSGSRSVTNYRQYVHLFIYDGRLSPSDELVRRYEGKAEGSGYLNDLTKIVPSGLKALLVEFPGKSGTSKSEKFYGLDQTP